MPAGRPTKLLDARIQKEIIESLKMGNYLETAAAFSGIDVVTLRRWIKRGDRELQRIDEKGGRIRKSEALYVEFCTACKKAMAEAEMRDVLLIYQAAKDNWQAAAWRLERKFPERWSRKDRHEITGKNGGAIEIGSAKERLLKRIQEMRRPGEPMAAEPVNEAGELM